MPAAAARPCPPRPRPTPRSGRPRCPPSEEPRHHPVDAPVRTSGRQSCGAGASKTIFVGTAGRPRGSRAASRARCAGRARDMFFVRPNATGHDLPSPSCVAMRGRQGQAMARHVLLELELDQAGVARGTRRDRTVRAPRSRSHCSCRPHLLRAGPPRRSTSANMSAAARPGTFDGSARRRSCLSASRVSVALRVCCTSRCSLNISGLGSGLGLCVCSPVVSVE